MTAPRRSPKRADRLGRIIEATDDTAPRQGGRPPGYPPLGLEPDFYYALLDGGYVVEVQYESLIAKSFGLGKRTVVQVTDAGRELHARWMREYEQQLESAR